MDREFSNSPTKQSFAWFSLGISLFESAEIDTVVLWESDQGLLFSDDENVSFSGGEGLSVGVLDVDDIEGPEVPFDVLDLTDSTNIVSTCDVAELAGGVLDPAFDLVLLEVVPDGVSFSDVGVWESNGSRVVGDDVGDLVGSDGSGFDFKKFVVGFCVFDLDEDESSLDVVEESVAFSGFYDGEYIHDSDWELSISSDFIIDFETSFLVHDCRDDFATASDDFESMPGLRCIST
jgi:hypothetical protein